MIVFMVQLHNHDSQPLTMFAIGITMRMEFQPSARIYGTQVGPGIHESYHLSQSPREDHFYSRHKENGVSSCVRCVQSRRFPSHPNEPLLIHGAEFVPELRQNSFPRFVVPGSNKLVQKVVHLTRTSVDILAGYSPPLISTPLLVRCSQAHYVRRTIDCPSGLKSPHGVVVVL